MARPLPSWWLASCIFFLPYPIRAAALPDTLAQRLVACTSCHARTDQARGHAYFPRIGGKPAGYLYNQLTNFRDGRRQYPVMTYMVTHLPDAYLIEIADYFAAQHPPPPPERPVDLQPRAHERHDHHELGQAFGKETVLERICLKQRSQPGRCDQHSQQDACNRERQRQLPKRHRQPRSQQHDGSEHDQQNDVVIQSAPQKQR